MLFRFLRTLSLEKNHFLKYELQKESFLRKKKHDKQGLESDFYLRVSFNSSFSDSFSCCFWWKFQFLGDLHIGCYQFGSVSIESHRFYLKKLQNFDL